MVDPGERGATGDRGVTGERGPKGDHGQEGHSGKRGRRGAVGARGPTNRLAVIGYLILTGAVAWSFHEVAESRDVAARQVNRINQAQCASLQNLYAVIRKTILDSEMAIDTLAYYQEHPQERAEAHARNQDTLARFKTPPCPPDITIP